MEVSIKSTQRVSDSEKVLTIHLHSDKLRPKIHCTAYTTAYTHVHILVGVVVAVKSFSAPTVNHPFGFISTFSHKRNFSPRCLRKAAQ